MKFYFKDEKEFIDPVLEIVIKNQTGNENFGINNRHISVRLYETKVKEGIIVYIFDACQIYGEELYCVEVYFGDKEENCDTIIDTFTFYINPIDFYKSNKLLNTKFN